MLFPVAKSVPGANRIEPHGPEIRRLLSCNQRPGLEIYYVNMQHFALKIGAPFLILFSALWPSLKARRQSESGCRNLLSFPTLVIDNSPRRP
jgi:hypothetical protein